MSATNGSAVPQEAAEIADKGKGKSVETATGHDTMEESESEEESGVEDVSRLPPFLLFPHLRTQQTETNTPLPQIAERTSSTSPPTKQS
jgi:hypothetical protein